MAKATKPEQIQFDSMKKITKGLRDISDLVVLHDRDIYMHSIPDGMIRYAVLHPDIDISEYANIICGPNALYEFLSKTCKTGISASRTIVNATNGIDMEVLKLSDTKKELSAEFPSSVNTSDEEIILSCYPNKDIEWVKKCASLNEYEAIPESCMKRIFDYDEMIHFSSKGLEMGLSKNLFPLSSIETRISVNVILGDDPDIINIASSVIAVFKEELPYFDLYTYMRFLNVHQ